MKKQLITILTFSICAIFLAGCGKKVTYINLPQPQSVQPARITQGVYSTQNSNAVTYSEKQHLNLSHEEAGKIYFTIPQLSPFVKTDGEREIKINPIHCTFLTNYTGKVRIQIDRANNSQDIVTNITASTPFSYTFQGYFLFPAYRSINTIITNYGCNTLVDGDKCIHAIEKHVDNAIVKCS